MWFERKEDEDKPRFFALHENDVGAVDGYAVYTVKHEWVRNVPANVLEVNDLIADEQPRPPRRSGASCFDVDLVATVKAEDRPIDDELLWLVAEPRRLNAVIQDGLFVRVLDVERALSGRRYSADGRLVLEIDDAFRPATAGPVRARRRGRRGVVPPRTDADPDLTLGVTSLGSARTSAASRSASSPGRTR